jgi:hypothetical protein
MKPLLFALLLAGCAIPTQELYMQRAVCVQEGGDCAELELAIARREVAIQRREDAKAPDCEDAEYIPVCDLSFGKCSRSGRNKWVCISREDIRRALY